MANSFETPLGEIPLDREIMDNLLTKPNFYELPEHVDEAEHSLEMQLPYLRLLFSDDEGVPADFKLIPIMVGVIEDDTRKKFG